MRNKVCVAKKIVVYAKNGTRIPSLSHDASDGTGTRRKREEEEEEEEEEEKGGKGSFDFSSGFDISGINASRMDKLKK